MKMLGCLVLWARRSFTVGAVWCLWLLLCAVPANGQTPPAPSEPADDGTASEQVEAAYVQLGRLSEAVQHVPNTTDIGQQLTAVEANLETIYQTLHESGQLVGVRQLQTFRTVLGDMQQELTTWRGQLSVSGRELARVQADLRRIDATLRRYAPQLAAAQDSLLDETVTSIRRKRARSLALVLRQRIELTRLQNRVSNDYIHLLELNDNVATAFRQLRVRGLVPQEPALFRASDADTSQRAQTARRIQQAYTGETQLESYYFSRHREGWLWTMVTGLGFFLWVGLNYRWARRAAPAAELDHAELTHLKALPIGASLIAALSLAPFFDLQAPAGYVGQVLALLLLVLAVHLRRPWPRPLYRGWLAFTAPTLVLVVLAAVPAPTTNLRWLLVTGNLGAVGWAFWWQRRLRQHADVVAGVVPWVLYGYAGLNLLAVVANLAGYLSLTNQLTTLGANSLIHIVALSVFVRLMTQAVNLQIQRVRLASGESARFNFDLLERQLRLVLTTVVIVLWSLVLLVNLNLYSLAYQGVVYLLTRPLQFGSLSFTLANVLFCSLILLLTFQAQRYVGYFYSDSNESFSYDAVRRGAKPVVLRLVVFAAGFLLAAFASGLPLDKITIVFGALSVGIGLGLQNIVNNLVSGVILIFERPFSIGDYIEVAGKTGRVKDVGIRASKLVSMAGSEIIVPNGDLLSGHVINWTLSNNHIRVELELKLDAETQLDQARQLIKAEVASNTSVLAQAAPEILLRNVNGQAYELKVLFWIDNIRQEQVVKSELLASIHDRLTAVGIQLR
jgi:potassium efflux system protein